MAQVTAADVPTPVSTTRSQPVRRRGLNERKRSRTGLLFVLPFAVVFLAFLVAPLLYAFYLSLYSKGLATGVVFAGLKNYRTAFTDPSFLNKLNAQLSKPEHKDVYKKARFGNTAFTIAHYALDVTYEVEGFLEKLRRYYLVS